MTTTNKSIILAIIFLILLYLLITPNKIGFDKPTLSEIVVIQNNSLMAVSSPTAPSYRVYAILTKFTNRPEETDDTPNIMASGKRVYIGAIACPANLPFGTTIEIDGKIYTCQDRMNLRYRNKNHFDIFEFNLTEAINFGRQKKQIIIYY